MSMFASVNGTGFLSKTLNSDITLTSSLATPAVDVGAGADCARATGEEAAETRKHKPAHHRATTCVGARLADEFMGQDGAVGYPTATGLG
jgi:hypothetical protein